MAVDNMMDPLDWLRKHVEAAWPGGKMPQRNGELWSREEAG